MSKRVFGFDLDMGIVEVIRSTVVKHGTEYAVYSKIPLKPEERSEVIAFLRGELERPDWSNNIKMYNVRIPKTFNTLTSISIRRGNGDVAWSKGDLGDILTIGECSIDWSGEAVERILKLNNPAPKPFTGDNYNLNDLMQYGSNGNE